MTTTLAIAPNQITAQKLKRAKAIFAEILQVEGALRLNQRALLCNAFGLGCILTELKEEIGHGNWMLWLPANFSELGQSDEMRMKQAQRCMNLYRDNASNSKNSSNLTRINPSDFSTDSERKFMWGYIKAKERPQLEGDEPVSAKPHYLSFVNHWTKWKRQLSLGHIPLPPVIQFRKEMENPLREIIEIGGKEWAREVIA